jgi:hypothetical protein
MVFFNGRMNSLRKKKRRGIYTPPANIVVAVLGAEYLGQVSQNICSSEYPAPGPNIQPKYLPPSRKLHAQVLSEISRGADNLALGQIIRPHPRSCRPLLDLVLSPFFGYPDNPAKH